MAKVYAFPVKKKLPKSIEERLHEVAKEYIEVLSAAYMLLGEHGTDQMSYEELVNLVADAYAEGLVKAAVNQMDES